MITDPIAFIFGAGVSSPYGYPLGEGLMNEVIGEATLPQVPQFYDTFGVSSNEIETFGEHLRESRVYSVDAFIEHRPEFQNISKLFIAKSLIKHERKNLIINESTNEGIYRYIFNKMNSNWEDFHKNSISFITFNYDRSFEQFMFSAIKNKYGKSDEEVTQAMSFIPIIHVHGKLDPLPWQAPKGRPYGENVNTTILDMNVLSEASKEIKLLSANEKNTVEFDKSYELLIAANKIYFLGFSYFDESMKRLRIADVLHTQNPNGYSRGTEPFKLPKFGETYKLYEIMGTGYDFGRSEKLTVETKWGFPLAPFAIKAMDFIRNYVYFGNYIEDSNNLSTNLSPD